jgi:hypothetical protein
MATTIKMRILNLFKKWIEGQEQDFTDDSKLCQIISVFLTDLVEEDSKRSPYALGMLETLKEIGGSTLSKSTSQESKATPSLKLEETRAASITSIASGVPYVVDESILKNFKEFGLR